MSIPVHTPQSIAADCGAIKIVNEAALTLTQLAWDSRQPGSEPAHTLFLALPGATRDGHQYIPAAIAGGIRCFLVSDERAITSGACFILVADVMAALHRWAAAHRSRFTGHLLAITGSNGKTTVKEWLADVMQPSGEVYRSPRSYNSQLGVPVSLLGMDLQAPVALMEAGISRRGEMEKLTALLQPRTGLLTHMGDAHAEGFHSFEEKLSEKLKLFDACETILLNGDDGRAMSLLSGRNIKSIGRAAHNHLVTGDVMPAPGGWIFSVVEKGEEHPFHLPVGGDAALENVQLVILAARHLGLGWDALRAAIARLSPVSMRTEMITDNPEVTVINDAYNADASSVHNAFSLLASSGFHPRRIAILTDLEHQGSAREDLQRNLLGEAERRFSKENVLLVGPVFRQLVKDQPDWKAYSGTDELIAAFDYDFFGNSTVLLKGARRFELEQLIPFLTRRATATWFKVNMNALAHNYREMRSRLKPATKLMAMVKAFSYGSGSWEIAEALANEGADYLAVASPTEGIALRTRGIATPIMVMNAEESAFPQLFHFNLEPEVFDLSELQGLVNAAKRSGIDSFPVHLKVDTGMGRLGFLPAQRDEVIAFLKAHPQVRVVSILSHLAAADEPSLDAYTHEQARHFLAFSQAVSEALGYQPIRHLLNTAGLLRFPEYQFEMVRTGIGLYGISPVPGEAANLEEVGSLHSAVQQVHEYAAGTYIGYGCSARTTRPSRIATVPVGYADGVRRSLGNGRLSVLIKGRPAPIFGRVCMDMIMIDVTDVPGVKAGDEVVLFGHQGDAFQSVNEVADKCGTIAYEILSGISQRVRRVYVRE